MIYIIESSNHSHSPSLWKTFVGDHQPTSLDTLSKFRYGLIVQSTSCDVREHDNKTGYPYAHGYLWITSQSARQHHSQYLIKKLIYFQLSTNKKNFTKINFFICQRLFGASFCNKTNKWEGMQLPLVFNPQQNAN